MSTALEAQLKALQEELAEVKRQRDALQAQAGPAVTAGARSVVLGGPAQGSTFITGNIYTGPPVRDPEDALRIYRRVLLAPLRFLPLRSVDVGASDPAHDQRHLELAQVYVELDTRSHIEIKRRVEKLLARRGKMPGDGVDPEQEEQSLWDKLCAASVQGRIPMGPKAGWRVRRLGEHPVLLPPGDRYLCADADGFNVHAHTSAGAAHKEDKERLCRYILRPALCGQRRSLLPSGDVVFHRKRTWSDGTRYLVFTPLELIEKLAVLVPPPHKHMVAYHGVLSSAGKRLYQEGRVLQARRSLPIRPMKSRGTWALCVPGDCCGLSFSNAPSG